MNTITLTIAATPGNLARLAQAFGSEIDDLIGAEDCPVVRKAEEAPAETIHPGVIKAKYAPAPEDPTVPEMAEPPAADPEPAPAPARAVTKEDVRKAAIVLTKAGKTDELGEILGRYGAAKLSQVNAGDYSALLTDLEAAS